MRIVTGFCLCACATALCLGSGLFSSSTMVVLSRTMADPKTRHQSAEDGENVDDQKNGKNRERSLIIGAVSSSSSSVLHSHSNRSRRHEYEDDDDEEEDDEEDRYEDRFVFVGANYRFADKRGDDNDDDDVEEDVGRRETERRADDNEGIRRRTGGKRFEIDVEIGRSRGKAKRNGLPRPDRRLRRQENPKTTEIPPGPDDTPGGPTEEPAAVDRLSPLGFIDAMQTSLPPDCLSSTSTGSRTITLAHDLPPALHSTFTEQTSSLVQIANVLNNLFAGSHPADDDLSSPDRYGVFYYSLVRAVVESNEALSAAAIGFKGRRDEEEEDEAGDRGPKDRRSGPFAYRNRTNGRVYVRDLANATQGYFSREEVSDERMLSWINRSPSLPASSSSLSPHSFHSSVATGKRAACPSEAPARSGAVDHSDQRLLSAPPTVTEIADGSWSRPYFDCAVGARTWLLTYSLPFFGCSNSEIVLKGIVKIELDLSKVDINQCPNAGGIFEKTDRCHPSTSCTFVAKHGFRRGGYRCTCQTGYYPPASSATPSRHGHHAGGGGGGGGSKPVSFDGPVIERSYLLNLTAAGAGVGADFACLPCAEGCERCDDDAPCPGSDDFIVSVIALVLQSVTMTATLLATVVVIRLRHTKVMKASFWVLLEIIIFGALMMYATVVIQYVTPSDVTCILVPWFREIGFIIVYGSLTLKVYRVLAEFQSRKAQRILLRDKDLLKYLATMVTIVVGYMVTWTVINVDHVWKGSSMVHFENGTKYSYCNSTYWDYVIEIEEFLFLLTAIYICYCIRSAPSFYLESKYISWAIYNETALSAIFNIIRHCLWSTVHPNYLYWMYFIRCQMTVTVTVLLVIGTKVWYIHRPPDDAICRRRTYSTTDAQDTGAPEATKLTPSIGYGIGGGGGGGVGGVGGGGGGGGEGDVGDINLSDMNPDDIRAELKRLYTQLQIYKTKSMRKDNPHISKRRGGRKPTHRRFSLQAFHYNKHKLQQGSSSAEAASCEHENEASRSPEESTNSIDVVPAAVGAAAAVEGDSAGPGGGPGGPGGGDGEGRARSTSLSSRTASVHR